MKNLSIAFICVMAFVTTTLGQDIKVEYTSTTAAQGKFAIKSSKKKFYKGKFESGVCSNTSELELMFTGSIENSYQLEFRKSDQGEYKCYKIKGGKVVDVYRYIKQSYEKGYVTIELKQSYTSWDEVLRFRAADPNEDISHFVEILDKIKSDAASEALAKSNTPVVSSEPEDTNTVVVDGVTYVKARKITVNGEEYTEVINAKPLPDGYSSMDSDSRNAINDFGTKYRRGARTSAFGLCLMFTGAIMISVDQGDGITGTGSTIGSVFFLSGGVTSLVGQIQLWTSANGLRLSTDGTNLKLNF
jgi:hypothetical protein